MFRNSRHLATYPPVRQVGNGWSIMWNCLLPVAYCLLLLMSCNSNENKLQQYSRQGEELYLKHCSNCHQKNGSGLGLVYPPVDVSDFVDSRMADVVCLIEHGKQGELKVNGKSFNMAMPGIPALTDLEIAEITTYLYNNWGRENGLIDVHDVTRILKKCK